MIKIWVLIMVFSGGTSQSGVATLNQEFTSFEKCEFARLHIEKSVENQSMYSMSTKTRSTGCFEK